MCDECVTGLRGYSALSLILDHLCQGAAPLKQGLFPPVSIFTANSCLDERATFNQKENPKKLWSYGFVDQSSQALIQKTVKLSML